MKTNYSTEAHELLGVLADRNGMSIQEHSSAAPFLLILLRHAGCSFCRETLKELADSMKHITAAGYQVGLVHMDRDEEIAEQLKIYGLENLPRFRDPERKLYKAFGLRRMPLQSAFKPNMWKRGIQANKRFGYSWPKVDPMQLPGAFLIDQGVIVAGESTLSPEEQPDFLALLIRSEAVA